MDSQTLSWLIMALVLVFGIHTVSHYATIRLLTTGRGMFERKPHHQDPAPRIVAGGFER